MQGREVTVGKGKNILTYLQSTWTKFHFDRQFVFFFKFTICDTFFLYEFSFMIPYSEIVGSS